MKRITLYLAMVITLWASTTINQMHAIELRTATTVAQQTLINIPAVYVLGILTALIHELGHAIFIKAFTGITPHIYMGYSDDDLHQIRLLKTFCKSAKKLEESAQRSDSAYQPQTLCERLPKSLLNPMLETPLISIKEVPFILPKYATTNVEQFDEMWQCLEKYQRIAITLAGPLSAILFSKGIARITSNRVVSWAMWSYALAYGYLQLLPFADNLDGSHILKELLWHP